MVHTSSDSGTGSIGKYDEYGVGGTSRFRFTGKYWLGEANLLYSRARIYDARLGRFLQTDPIGYGDSMNMYAYVGRDPVNSADPSGTCAEIVIAHGGDCAESTARAYVANAAANGSGIVDPNALVHDIVSYLRDEMDLADVKSNYYERASTIQLSQWA